eukprot:6183233-Pleurochrysis_carterae.AAC.1
MSSPLRRVVDRSSIRHGVGCVDGRSGCNVARRGTARASSVGVVSSNQQRVERLIGQCERHAVWFGGCRSRGGRAPCFVSFSGGERIAEGISWVVVQFSVMSVA